MKKGLLFTLIFGLNAFLLSSMNAGIEVGAAVVEITPTAGVDKMVRMGGETTLVDKIHDPISAKALVWQDGEASVAQISLELIWIEEIYMDQIRAAITRELGIAHVIVSLTHTHGSGRPSKAVSERMVDQAVEAARLAQASLEPATVGFGRGEIEESYNRRLVNEDGSVEMLWNNSKRIESLPIDNEVGVISIRRNSDQSVLATLVNYNAHPVISMNFEELIVSSDYPGAMARKVESSIGGVCIFFLGAAGDINAYDADMFRQADEETVFAAVERLGNILAEEVVGISNGIKEFSHEKLSYEASYISMGLREHGLHADKDQMIEVDTFLIGKELALVTFPGELFVELGMDLKKHSPTEATFVLANSNGNFMYLPTLKAACEGGYGASSGTALEVGAGDRMVHQAIVAMLHQVERVKPLESR